VTVTCCAKEASASAHTLSIVNLANSSLWMRTVEAALGVRNGVNAVQMRTRIRRAGGRGDELSQCAAVLNTGQRRL